MKLLVITFVITFGLMSTIPVLAQTVCTQNGNSIVCNNGQNGTRVGNTMIWNNGAVSTVAPASPRGMYRAPNSPYSNPSYPANPSYSAPPR
jgi:hypothetical protein